MMHTSDRWHALSLAEQLGNIGSEVHRAALAERGHPERFRGASDRALELIDLTLSDPRWRKRARELGRIREVISDAVLGGREYGSRFSDLEPYFDRFAFFAARPVT